MWGNTLGCDHTRDVNIQCSITPPQGELVGWCWHELVAIQIHGGPQRRAQQADMLAPRMRAVQLRLVGGTEKRDPATGALTYINGRLEVFYQGQWGTVCRVWPAWMCKAWPARRGPAPADRPPQLIACLLHCRSVLRALKMRMPKWLVASWGIPFLDVPLAESLGWEAIQSG